MDRIEQLQQQIDAMNAELADLRAQLILGPPRLGPRPPTDEVNPRIVEVLTAAITATRTSPPKICTTNGQPVEEVRRNQTNETGQHDGYIVLCPDERAKGFVRPYRDAYKHKTCGTVTTMGRSLSETYARDPKFYGATFCCECNRHLPVVEFTWTTDGQQVGS